MLCIFKVSTPKQLHSMFRALLCFRKKKQKITLYTTLVQREKLDEWLEKQKSIRSFVLAIPIVPLVNIYSMSFKYRIRRCNKSYFFLCLNLRQYDTFVALAIAFNLGRNKLPRPGPFSLGYSFRPARLA